MYKYKLCFKGYLSLLVMLFLFSVPVGAEEIEYKGSLDILGGADKLADTDGDGLLEIHSPAALELINLDLAASYELIDNILLFDTDNRQSIGTKDNPFTGALFGNGYRMTFLGTIGNISGGLFGYVREANISNIYIEVDEFTPESSVGILAGGSYNSNATNVHVVINSPTIITGVGSVLFGDVEGGIIWESSVGIESDNADDISSKPVDVDNRGEGQEPY